jgi:hypothetical protein
MLDWFGRKLREMREVKRDERGFTLIELLLLVVIGILAAIAIPIFLSQRESAQAAAVESEPLSSSHPFVGAGLKPAPVESTIPESAATGRTTYAVSESADVPSIESFTDSWGNAESGGASGGGTPTEGEPEGEAPGGDDPGEGEAPGGDFGSGEDSGDDGSDSSKSPDEGVIASTIPDKTLANTGIGFLLPLSAPMFGAGFALLREK